MHRVVTLPLYLASLILSAAFIIGVASCDWGPPEPDCEPPPPSECKYDGQILWPDPLCAYECNFQDAALGEPQKVPVVNVKEA